MTTVTQHHRRAAILILSCQFLISQGFHPSNRYLFRRFGVSPRRQQSEQIATKTLSNFPVCRFYPSFFSPLHSTQTEQPDTFIQQHEPLSVNQLTGLFGGDFCGLSASFSATTGKVLPLPEHWIPSSLEEWGQVPSCLEVIVSEELTPSDSYDQASLLLNRHTVTVLPETGCAVDNLETIPSQVQSALTAWQIWSPTLPPLMNDISTAATKISTPAVAALAYSSLPDPTITDDYDTNTIDQQVVRLEACFGVNEFRDYDNEFSGDSTSSTTTTTTTKSNNTSDSYRIRVQLDVDVIQSRSTKLDGQQPRNLPLQSLQLRSPIQINLERQFNTTSSQGTIAYGGGFDGRTLSQLMGETLRKKHSFAEQNQPQPSSPSIAAATTTTISIDTSVGNPPLVSLTLPPNVTVTVRALPDQLPVVDVTYSHSLMEEKADDSPYLLLHRTTVRFSIPPTKWGVESQCWSDSILL